MNRFALTILTIAAIAVAPIVFAQQAAPTPVADAPTATNAAPLVVPHQAMPTQSDSDELGALDREEQLWKKRATIAKYKADVKAAGAHEVGGLTTPLPLLPMSGGLPPGAMLGSGSPAAIGGSSRPRLVRVGGADGRYDALIDVNGHTVDVIAGDTLDEGWTVASVTASSVKLVRAGHTIVLKV